MTQLAEVETLLSKFDPDFDAQSTNYGQEKGLLSAYQNGFGEGSTIAEQYQMHLNVERIRAPEVLFLNTARNVSLGRALFTDALSAVDGRNRSGWHCAVHPVYSFGLLESATTRHVQGLRFFSLFFFFFFFF